MAKEYPMTPIGKRKLEEELVYLKENRQKEINNEIKHLRGFCDFSEDVSFSEMLDQQSLVKERIQTIEQMLYNAKLINPNDEHSSTVMFGSVVTFIELPNGEEETYIIVGEIDANPIENKISFESPIGKSLLGSRKGDEVLVETPVGKIKIKISGIN